MSGLTYPEIERQAIDLWRMALGSADEDKWQRAWLNHVRRDVSRRYNFSHMARWYPDDPEGNPSGFQVVASQRVVELPSLWKEGVSRDTTLITVDPDTNQRRPLTEVPVGYAQERYGDSDSGEPIHFFLRREIDPSTREEKAEAWLYPLPEKTWYLRSWAYYRLEELGEKDSEGSDPAEGVYDFLNTLYPQVVIEGLLSYAYASVEEFDVAAEKERRFEKLASQALMDDQRKNDQQGMILRPSFRAGGGDQRRIDAMNERGYYPFGRL